MSKMGFMLLANLLSMITIVICCVLTYGGWLLISTYPIVLMWLILAFCVVLLSIPIRDYLKERFDANN